MTSTPSQGSPEPQVGAGAAREPAGLGRLFVDVLTALDCTTYEVAHTLPAVDHRSRLPTRPTDADLDRIARLLHTNASDALYGAFRSWRERTIAFEDAVQRLTALHDPGPEHASTYRTELTGRLDEVRARRAAVGEAAEDLREQIVRELDTALSPGARVDARGAAGEQDPPIR